MFQRQDSAASQVMNGLINRRGIMNGRWPVVGIPYLAVVGIPYLEVTLAT